MKFPNLEFTAHCVFYIAYLGNRALRYPTHLVPASNAAFDICTVVTHTQLQSCAMIRLGRNSRLKYR